ncbi:DUF4142 domain-containing protein [Flavobacterium limi]|uniref:DUF4142 domain-containing protein n=1 Tax=Flavobacterium limi TaxID=2045105 RepID=A0ABQ1UHA7_9FLAO|nr:DUF4142 domain-containing protein [Flavobacterium limi]GGF16624.1 hypothetical protein GCM10011518_27570 [Flavobacterium limi]
MKKILLISKVVLGAGVLLLSLNSCKNETKQEDPKEVAEDQNEAKFDSIDTKEDDSEFLVDAAEIDLAEIEIGKLAQTKSTNAEVKKFGKMLVDEHTKSAAEVKTIAGSKNISLPTALTEEGKDEYDKLNEKSGVDFDKKFADMMVDGHEKAIDKFTKAAETANDAEIKTWASKNVSTLTAHLQHAKQLKESLDKK